MAECLLHRTGASIKPGVMTLSSYSITVYGGTGTNSVTYEYNGNGVVSASSSNTGVATVSVSGNSVTVTYVAPGSTTITVSAPKTNKFTECSATLSVTCSRTALTKPSLTATSYTQTSDATFSPGYNNYNSSLMTVSGTTSASSPGSYAIYFNLKDTNRYCWSDGSTGQVGCGWSITAGTVTFYVKPSNNNFTMTFTKTWAPWSSMSNESYQHRYYDGSYATTYYLGWSTAKIWFYSGNDVYRAPLYISGNGPTNGTTYYNGNWVKNGG